MKQNIILLLVIAAIVIAAAFYTTYQRQQEIKNYSDEVETREELERRIMEISATDFTVGSDEPRVRLLVYGDGDCPFCKQFEPRFDQLMASYPEDVAITYRHYKLPIYPDSYHEHIVLECVGMIAGAEQYRAFQNQIVLEQTGAGVGDYQALLATQARVYLPENTGDEFTACLTSDEVVERIESKVASGNVLGVRQTPTVFFIKENGDWHRQNGSIYYETLVERLNAFLGIGNELSS